MGKNYTAIPHVYLEECAELSDEEFGRLMRALLRFSIDGTPMDLPGNERFLARRMMNQERIHAEKYAQTVRRRSELGRAAAEARWHGTSPCGGIPAHTSDAIKDTDTGSASEEETETVCFADEKERRKKEAPADTETADRARYAGLSPDERADKARRYARVAALFRSGGQTAAAERFEAMARAGGPDPDETTQEESEP